MKRISIRLPEDLIAAYDDADGTRSAVMRRRLSEAVRDGEVSGVDADLRTLVEAEDAKDRARLARRRGSFRERCHSFYADKWSSGLVTPRDAEDMAESWEAEAALYGAPYVAFVDAVTAAARDVAREGEVEPSVATLYHDRLTRQGMTHIEQFDVDEYVRVQIFEALYGPDGRKRTVRREWFEDELSHLPDAVVQRQLAAHRECLYATDEIVELRRDPYRSESAERDGPLRPTV